MYATIATVRNKRGS